MGAGSVQLTVHSRRLRRGSVDGRTRAGKMIAAARRDLVEMVGGDPTPAERLAIERCAWLKLHLALIDERVASGAILSAHDQRSYTAYTSTLLNAMRRLRNSGGPAEPHEPSLAELLAADEVERRSRSAA
jgi:hypothetical protein